ncbi:unnamed protein product [Phaeothamnion confervicola]
MLVFFFFAIYFLQKKSGIVGALFFMAMVILFLVVEHLIKEYRLVVMWLYMSWMIMFIVSGSVAGLFDNQNGHDALRYAVWSVAAFLCVVSVGGHYMTYTLYPKLVRDGKMSTAKWFGIARGRYPNEAVYLSAPARIAHRLGLVRLRRFSYEGGLDAEGRPHGGGQWEELAINGERLRGWWRHGRPVGPFRSSEKGTGFAFHGVRVGFVRNIYEEEKTAQNRSVLEKKMAASAFWPKRIEGGKLAYGVASVECSVSGKFFRHLPQVSYGLGGADQKPKSAPRRRRWRRKSGSGDGDDAEGAEGWSSAEVDPGEGDALAGSDVFQLHASPALGVAYVMRNLVTPLDVILGQEQNNLEMTYDPDTDQVRVEHGLVHPHRSADGIRRIVIRVSRDAVAERSGRSAATLSGALAGPAASGAATATATTRDSPNPAETVFAKGYATRYGDAAAAAITGEKVATSDPASAGAGGTSSYACRGTSGGAGGGAGRSAGGSVKGAGSGDSRKGAIGARSAYLMAPGTAADEAGEEGGEEGGKLLARYQQQLGDMAAMMGAMASETHALEVEGIEGNAGELFEVHGPEILIFMPGFNSSTEGGLKVLAQLLTLGDFPPFVRPIVFSWPAANVITYHAARDLGASSEGTRKDFRSLLEGFRDLGFRKIHIMAHSMGARVLMNVCTDFDGIVAPAASAYAAAGGPDEYKALFDHSSGGGGAAAVGRGASPGVTGKGMATAVAAAAGAGSGGGAAARLLQLETVTLLSPDYELESFVKAGGTYDILHSYCRRLTMYGDCHDGALLAGYIFNGFKSSLGRNVYRICRPPVAAEPSSASSAVPATGAAAMTAAQGGGAAAMCGEDDEENQLGTATVEMGQGGSSSGHSGGGGGGGCEGEEDPWVPEEEEDEDGSHEYTQRLVNLCNRRLAAVAPDAGLDDMRVASVVGPAGRELAEALLTHGADDDGGSGGGAAVSGYRGARAGRRGRGGSGDTGVGRGGGGGSGGGRSSAPVLMRQASSIYERRSEARVTLLDVDVMDTTLLEHNIHTIRHNFFNLNSAIVEDLRELIVHKRRAAARSNTTKKEGNVYTFRIAPSVVKNA